MKNFLTILQKEIKDYIFPIFCLGCEREGVWVCKECLATIGTNLRQACPVCNTYNIDGHCCNLCKIESSVYSIRAMTRYKEGGLISKMIRSFKYDYVEDLSSVFNKLLSRHLKEHRGIFSQVDFVLPIPLHPIRYAERGFNQADRIAEIVGKILNRPVLSVLKRVRHTKIQARLNRQERIKNVDNAFVCQEPLSVRGNNILLVDDVFTTGSTMQECSRVLLQARASRVSGFTVARG